MVLLLLLQLWLLHHRTVKRGKCLVSGVKPLRCMKALRGR